MAVKTFGNVMDDPKIDVTNSCYEALLDLKSTFPAWSEVQNNFYYHWTKVLDSIINYPENENQVLDFYIKALDPLIKANGSGIESNAALELVRKLDEYRTTQDESFTKYELEQILNRDTSSIKPKKKAPKPQLVKQQTPAPANTPQSGNHVYGTRTKSKRLVHGVEASKLDYNIGTMGTHLKKGFSSNYVWDFMVPADEEHEIVYVNPICMEMDKMIYACESSEDVLTLLVTHRGSFVQQEKNRTQPTCDDLFAGYNLMLPFPKAKEVNFTNLEPQTPAREAILKTVNREILIHLQDPQNQEDLRCINHSAKLSDAIKRDERYELLLSDLYKHRTSLDVASACFIITSLDALGHHYYRLYNGILRHLLKMDIDPSDSVQYGHLLMETCDCFARAGFYNVPLYSKVTRLILDAHDKNMDDTKLVMKVVGLYTRITSYDPVVFSKMSSALIGANLSSQELGDVALAFAIHGNLSKMHDCVLYWVASQLQEKHVECSPRQLGRCLVAFAKSRLYFPSCWNACTSLITRHLQRLLTSPDEPGISLAELGLLVEQICNFDPKNPTVSCMLQQVLGYMEYHIDAITEAIAINLAFAICTTDSAGQREWLTRHGIGTWSRHLKDIHRTILECRFDAKCNIDTQMDKALVNESLNPYEAIPSISILDDHGNEFCRLVINELNVRNYPERPLGVDLLIKHALEHLGHRTPDQQRAFITRLLDDAMTHKS
ncbi:uncharacterized protein BdWA1_003599 [Babesia duncani]|uniref:Uncharacterized protein n=1 Tax=Babesia duncani TaxID=323732 RepID=A0AAD9UMM9_9APIC|nr:hypothetical protein BdWA1_003599 [Babesia duncani]